MSFADKIISFNKKIAFHGHLPQGIHVMNPFKEDRNVIPLMEIFYKKYYDDDHQRHLILGINPGRLGAGLTGIPFTDPKRLESECGIKYPGKITHEPSSVFIYDMINAFGGTQKFYHRFYISAVSPLGLTKENASGKELNFNYYDTPELAAAMHDFIVECIKKQLWFGVSTHTCFCLGTGKNEKFLRKLNEEYHFFENIVALEHPRFIMQYKSKEKEKYVQKYLHQLRNA